MRALHAIVAALLGLLVPGSGHLWVGRVRRFLVVLGAFGVTLAVLTGTRAIATLHGFGVLALAGMAMLAFSVIDAAVMAVRGGRRGVWYSRWYVVLSWMIAGSIVSMALIGARETLFGYATMRMPSPNMRPTIRPGDIVLADTWVPKGELPVRTLVVVQVDGNRFMRRIKSVDAPGVYSVTLDLPYTQVETGVTRDMIVAVVTAVLWSPEASQCCIAITREKSS